MSPHESDVKPVIFRTLKGGRMITAVDVPFVKLALRKGIYQHKIAAYYGDNQGRVSEINTGKRYGSVPPAAQLPEDFPVN